MRSFERETAIGFEQENAIIFRRESEGDGYRFLTKENLF